VEKQEHFDIEYEYNKTKYEFYDTIENKLLLKNHKSIIIMDKKLDLGWCQEYMGLKYHMEEAYLEKNLDITDITDNPPYAIFSNTYCDTIDNLDHSKIYDYCFIGSINSSYNNRKWIIEFVKKYFTQNSIFINTDTNTNTNQDWQLLGDYDWSNKGLGFCPKSQINNQSKDVQYRIVKDNLFYFQTMCQSKFILCPAGDSSWSFRFYEILICKSIPIVESINHTYRTMEEANIKYEYILANSIKKITDINYNELIAKNTILFKQYHLLN
jgi:hypothetical protein